ncbi:MAG: hypothetical protein D4R65_05980 [Verrucomicrobiaceae bacterium]|nr:MAG: hypothetical protein D4R65_05980 [Verrucomicrobiaceae bacterium]
MFLFKWNAFPFIWQQRWLFFAQTVPQAFHILSLEDGGSTTIPLDMGLDPACRQGSQKQAARANGAYDFFGG